MCFFHYLFRTEEESLSSFLDNLWNVVHNDMASILVGETDKQLAIWSNIDQFIHFSVPSLVTRSDSQ